MKAEDISALAATVQAGIVIVAAVIAWWQVREARRLREAQAQPYVTVSLELNEQSNFMVDLVIKNVGTTVARDIRFVFDPQLVSSIDKPGRPAHAVEWSALQSGIQALVPGQSMRTLFDSLMSRYSEENRAKLPKVSEVTVTYTGDIKHRRWFRLAAEKYEYRYTLDFDVFYGSNFIGRKGLGDAVESLDGIRKVLKSWTDDDGIRTYTKGLDKRIADQEKMYQRILRERHSQQPRQWQFWHRKGQ